MHTNLGRHHVAALVLTTPLVLMLAVDWVVTGLTGERTWVTDDAQGGPATAVLVSVALAAAFAAIFAVLRAERHRLDDLGRLGRACRRVLLVGSVGMVIGNGIIHPAFLLADVEEGVLYDASGAVALAAIACTFLPSLVLGLAQVRRNTLGIGGRLLSLTVPAVLLTVATALVASDWASPVLLTAAVLVGLATVGAGAPTVGSPPARVKAHGSTRHTISS